AAVGAEAVEDAVVLRAPAIAVDDDALDAGDAAVGLDGLDRTRAGVVDARALPESEGVVGLVRAHGKDSSNRNRNGNKDSTGGRGSAPERRVDVGARWME